MEEQFKAWLISTGRQPTTANSYANAINRISEHYSENENLQTPIDIYSLSDQTLISKLSSDYSQTGEYSEFGYMSNSLYRASINRYSEFFVNNGSDNGESTNYDASLKLDDIEKKINFAYERDLQTTLCAQVSTLFPDYIIFKEDNNSGVEYTIEGKRIDVLLEHVNNKSLLAVELKSGVADYRVFGQISMYLGLLQKKFPNSDISGVIIAGSIDEGLQWACETTNKIKFKVYRMSLELEDI